MYSVTDEFSLAKNKLAKDIVGEIVLTAGSERAIKKWRDIFRISQKALANEIGVTPSVISDYESGRRKSPGIKIVERYVRALLKIDEDGGSNVIRSFSKTSHDIPAISNAIIDIREFSSDVSVQDICRHLSASVVVKSDPNKPVYGYTVIDSLKAITELSYNDLIKLYGITSQRALIFTKVSTGKSPMVAIKLTNIHPAVVILHGLGVVDGIAKRIAEVEGIPLAVSRVASADDIVEKMRELD